MCLTDVLWIPGFWFHEVTAMTPTISASIVANIGEWVFFSKAQAPAPSCLHAAFVRSF